MTAGFHCDCGLLVFKATSELERGDVVWKVLTEIQPFFPPNKCSLDCCKPLAKLQSSKNHNSNSVYLNSPNILPLLIFHLYIYTFSFNNF